MHALNNSSLMWGRHCHLSCLIRSQPCWKRLSVIFFFYSWMNDNIFDESQGFFHQSLGFKNTILRESEEVPRWKVEYFSPKVLLLQYGNLFLARIFYFFLNMHFIISLKECCCFCEAVWGNNLILVLQNIKLTKNHMNDL